MICAKEFAKHCDHVIIAHSNDGPFNYNIDPDVNSIYINGAFHCFERFIHLLPAIKLNNKIRLIYHGADEGFDRLFLESVKDKCTHIYAQNCEINHPMITKIPVGFTNNSPTRLEIDKDILCYVNFTIHPGNFYEYVTHQKIRKDCLYFFKNKDWAFVDSKIPFEEYNKQINRSKFVVCPLGIGIDTYKIYEAAYVGATPIVISTGLDDLYKKYGALIVNDWSEVTEELLKNYKHKKVSDDVFKVEHFI